MIIEYLEHHYPGKTQLFASDAETAFRARQLDRFFDLHVQVPMQKIVTDNFRPEGQNDAFGVEEAKGKLATAYDILETELAGRRWATGDRVYDCRLLRLTRSVLCRTSPCRSATNAPTCRAICNG